MLRYCVHERGASDQGLVTGGAHRCAWLQGATSFATEPFLPQTAESTFDGISDVGMRIVVVDIGEIIIEMCS